jgi:hypothetical protein
MCVCFVFVFCCFLLFVLFCFFHVQTKLTMLSLWNGCRWIISVQQIHFYHRNTTHTQSLQCYQIS